MRAGETGREDAAPRGTLTRLVQEGSCGTGLAEEAAVVAAPLQPLLPGLTGLGAQGARSLSGAERVGQVSRQEDAAGLAVSNN